MIAESLAEQLEKVSSETSHILYLLAEGEKIAVEFNPGNDNYWRPGYDYVPFNRHAPGLPTRSYSEEPRISLSPVGYDTAASRPSGRANVSNRASYTPHELPNKKTKLDPYAERISKTIENMAKRTEP